MNPMKPHIQVRKVACFVPPIYQVYTGAFERAPEIKKSLLAKIFPLFARDVKGSLHAEVFATKIDLHYLLMRRRDYLGSREVFGVVDDNNNRTNLDAFLDIDSRLHEEALRIGRVAAKEYHYELRET